MMTPPRIAPATGAADAVPQPQAQPKPQPAVTVKLGASKKWVLPPRPKPGRKPKAQNGGAQTTSAAKRPPHKRPAPGSSSTQPHRQSENESSRISAQPAASHSQDDDCGLCQREDGCLCSDIGIKDSKEPQKERDMGLNFDGFAPTEAVPLRRTASQAGSNSTPERARKFRRAGEVMAISVIAQPPQFDVKLTPSDSCGFCNDNTPCLCAGDGLDDANDSEVPHNAAESEGSAVVGTDARRGLISPRHSNSEPAEDTRETDFTSFSSRTKAHTEDIAPSGGALPPVTTASPPDIDYGCASCQKDPMSMLFCVSLGSAQALDPSSVAIPCTMAFRTIEKHPRFAQCDLGRLVGMLESSNRMIGVQSINRALQYLNSESQA